MTWAEFKGYYNLWFRVQILDDPKSPQRAALQLALQKKAAQLRELKL